jgi:Niemann-Pick C1 protein
LLIFYIRFRSDDPRERARYALKNVGVSVFIGIVTTKIIGIGLLTIVVTVLLFATSKIFQIYYFRMYFFLIVVGFFHGFVMMIFLSHINFGNKSYKI